MALRRDRLQARRRHHPLRTLRPAPMTHDPNNPKCPCLDCDRSDRMNIVWQEVKALRDLPAPAESAPTETRAFLDVCDVCETGTLYMEGAKPVCSLCAATQPLEDRIDALYEALAAAEWGGDEDPRVKKCPYCGELKQAKAWGGGHEDGCFVGLALNRWPGR